MLLSVSAFHVVSTSSKRNRGAAYIERGREEGEGAKLVKEMERDTEREGEELMGHGRRRRRSFQVDDVLTRPVLTTVVD